MSAREIISDRARRNEDGTITLTLRQPIVADGKTLDCLIFRPLKVKHILKLDTCSGPRSRTISMIESSVKVPAPALKEMDGMDFLDASEVVADFLARLSPIFADEPETSPTSSTGRPAPSDD